MNFFRPFFFAVLGFSSSVSALDRQYVYLASFPRSGSHWVRFLVEEATHIATCSMYKDPEYLHFPAPFARGGYVTDHGYTGTCRYPTQREPVLLKTHYPCFPRALKQTELAVVCLIRHPIDAFYSFYVYEKKNGVSQQIPNALLRKFIRKWREFYEFWDKRPGIVLIRYEDLYRNPGLCLSEIIQTVGYHATPEDIQRAVDRYPPAGGLLRHIGCYEEEAIELIQTELADLLLKYGYAL